LSLLSVNIDLVAAVREMRGQSEPDPAQAAMLAELAGADGITIQLRRNGRIIRDRDLYLLKGLVKSELTVELPPVDEVISKVLDIKPAMAILYADHLQATAVASTIDLGASEVDYSDLAARFSAVGVKVGYFIDPEPEASKRAAKHGADAVLINCSGYGDAPNVEQAQAELDRIDRAITAAQKAGLAVHCGRGLTLRNLGPLVELQTIDQFAVGFSLCSRALLLGLERTVKEYLHVLHRR
jgi:pyridoxine 5-phosphate synthase